MAKLNKVKINGWINLHKPAGIGSTQALGKVKRVLHPEKAGHGGTLDPLASGVLPIALGEATKTVAYAMDADKDYDFTVMWGEQRATDDLEGDVIATSDIRPTDDQIKSVLPQFMGNITQTPPIYSAIKIDGQRAYDLARAGEDIDMKSRDVVIHNLQLIETTIDTARFMVTSGKGMYVRSLGRDIAKQLGTVGYISTLIRTRVGAFSLDDAIPLDDFNDDTQSDNVLLPVQAALANVPTLVIDDTETGRLRRGMTLNFIVGGNAKRLPIGYDQGPFLAADRAGNPVAMVTFQAGEVKPDRVFNL
ncbi:MAG TPA: tRNA pseudouridine(55) synthase TruB [Alphaproteobacteria bacterium]